MQCKEVIIWEMQIESIINRDRISLIKLIFWLVRKELWTAEMTLTLTPHLRVHLVGIILISNTLKIIIEIWVKLTFKIIISKHRGASESEFKLWDQIIY